MYTWFSGEVEVEVGAQESYRVRAWSMPSIYPSMPEANMLYQKPLTTTSAAVDPLMITRIKFARGKPGPREIAPACFAVLIKGL